MIQFQLWAFTPGSDTPTILPRPLSWQASFVLSDLGSLQIVYPRGEVGHELLDEKYCDVEVRYWSGSAWVCPPQGRFSLVDKDPDPISERSQPTRTYTLQSYGWLLRRVLQERTTGLDSSGNRPFPSQSIGQVAGTLISEARAAGSIPNLSYVNSAGSGGSSPAIEVGKALLDILATARDEGLVEWLVQPDGTGQGRKLVAYSSVGVDRSTGVTPVELIDGRDVVAAPSKVSIQDLAAAALVIGDSGHYLRITNPGADIPYGVLPDVVQAGGLTDAAALEIAAQARLDRGASPRAQHTRQIIFDRAQWLPFIDYSLGDTVLGPDETGAPAPLRVRQITITMQSQANTSILGGNLVLGDRFTERDERQARLLRQLSGGAGAIAGAGRRPTTVADDQRLPSAPTGLNVGSTPYLDPDGAPKALATFGWVNPTTATDGSAMDPGSIEIWYRKGTTGAFTRLTTVQAPATSAQWSPFDAGIKYQFQVRAVSASGVAGPFTAPVESVMALDTTPPPVASRPSTYSRLGTVQITWNGRGSAGEVMPADFDYALLQRDTDAGFSAPVVVGRLTGSSLLVDGPLTVGNVYYYRLITVDRAGNAAAPGLSQSATVTGVTGPDLVANSVTANSIAVGALDGMLITGALIQTSATNPRAYFSDTKLVMTAADGTVLFQADASTGRVLMRSGTTGRRISLDTSDGLRMYNTAGQMTVYLDSTTGNAKFQGDISGSTMNGGTITGPLIQTAASGARIYLTTTTFAMTGADGVPLLYADTLGRAILRSGTTGQRFSLDTNDGFRLYNSAGVLTVFLDGSTGNAKFLGDLSGSTMTAGTLTAVQVQTSASNPRAYIGTNGFTMTNSAGTVLFQADASTGRAILRSGTTGARIALDTNDGLRMYNAAGSLTVYLDSTTGNAMYTGTVTASTFASTNTLSGTLSGGTLSGNTHSGGSLSGAFSSSATLTGGTYQTASSGQRAAMSAANGRLALTDSGGSTAYLYSSAGNLYALGDPAGGSIQQVSTAQMGLISSGSAIATPAYSTTTASAANVFVSSGGILMRSTSSIRYKIDVRDLPVDRRILALRPKSWRPRRTSHAVSTARQVGFLAEDAHSLGLRELVSYSRSGLPDALAYERISTYLVPIVAEHDTAIADLTAEIAALKAEIAALKGAAA